jgi:activator of HSP90 ATPase
MMPRSHPTRIIRHNVLIPFASPEDVYGAFLSSKLHAQFTGSGAKCSARARGRFTAWNNYISGKNVELVEGKKIVQEWKTSEWPKGFEPSILKISLKKKGSGTQLSMIQSRVPASQVDEYDKGWYESYWEPLKQYFRNRAQAKQLTRRMKPTLVRTATADR